MTEPAAQRAAEDEMRCPTCNARQAWSDECRRCKCDLSLLRQCWRTGEAERRRCLRELGAGRPPRALDHARRYAGLVGAAAASRLLGVCLLMCNDWPGARNLARDELRRIG
jgi:hypothetical protein